MEDFVAIPGYDGYKANRLGHILGKRKTILKTFIKNSGYYYCRNHTVHRLIALTFISNPLGLPEVDHINDNKLDNRAENLQWVTAKTNINKQQQVKNAKCYSWRKCSFQVQYSIDGFHHNRRFKDEDDAAFYVSLLKAIYPEH